MADKPKDLLLGAAKAVILLSQIVIIFAMVMLGIGIGALLTIGRARIFAEIASAGAPDYAFALLIAAFGLIMVFLGLASRFFKQLTAIIDSVSSGDPFQIENAERLTRMGWLSVAVHGLTLALIGLAAWFAPFLKRVGEHAEFGFDLGLPGILLTLILFILARVFRHGAEMREELEGTV